MHSIYRHAFQMITVLLLSVLLVACGGGERESRNRATDENPAGTTQQSAAAGETSSNEADTTIHVVARDFEYSLDANSAAAGRITFVVANDGSMPHDFAITIDGERHKTEMIKPGASGSLTVDLQAGSYDYICTVPGHDILGMKGTFTVN